MKLTLSRIAGFASASGEFESQTIASGYSIDSRTVQPGELFFAVKGERLDGHDYVEQALSKEAVAAVVQQDQLSRYPAKSKLLVVDDTLVALQSLATAVRRLWGKPLVAVTGSAGKTTTKDAIWHLLSTKYCVLKTEGNFNNHFGLPLMLLKLQPEHDTAVVEMGMSHAGEIAALTKIGQPNIGVVTNVAAVHLEFFHSVADIARAKYELVASLPMGGTAILNADDEYVSQFGRDFHGKVVRYGLRTSADVWAEHIEQRGPDGSTFDLIHGTFREHVHLPLVGAHNIYNALAAVAVALERGIALADAAKALAYLVPSDKRGQVVKVDNITVINDCYNSNPKALESMVSALAAMPARRHIVVAGEMLELGSAGPEMHRRAGSYIGDQKIDVLIGVRGLAQQMVDAAAKSGTDAMFVASPEEAGEWLAQEAKPGDIVLLKASRGVKLELTLEKWKQAVASR